MADDDAGNTENGRIRVLVTGASGYLAIHCIQQLLDQGYIVRGTVRDNVNPEKISPLKELDGCDRLELISADLHDKNVWANAVEECDYVLHIASPCPIVPADSIISTAVDGTMNVLRACAGCERVKKVVITSSCGAVNQGHRDRLLVYKEDSWTITDGSGGYVMKYHLSKTLAEKAAWDFVGKEPGVKFKLTVLNPTLMVGPLLHNTKGASATVISRFLDGSMLATPPFKLGIVNVDDVALAHIRAMRNPETDNHRILINAYTMSFREIAQVLRNEFATQGYRVPRFKAPMLAVRLFAFSDKESREMAKLGKYKEYFDNSKARRLLGMQFKDPQESLIDMCYMIQRGILPKKCEYKKISLK